MRRLCHYFVGLARFHDEQVEVRPTTNGCRNVVRVLAPCALRVHHKRSDTCIQSSYARFTDV